MSFRRNLYCLISGGKRSGTVTIQSVGIRQIGQNPGFVF